MSKRMDIIKQEAEEADRILKELTEGAARPETPPDPKSTEAPPPAAAGSEDGGPEGGTVLGQQVVPPEGEQTDGFEEKYKTILREMNTVQRKAAEDRKKAEEAFARIEALESELKKKAEAAPAPTPEPEDEDDQETQELRTQLPEYVKLAQSEIKREMRKLGTERLAKIEKELEERRENDAKSAATTARTTLYGEILKTHADAIDITNSEEFTSWVEEQPPFVADIMVNHLNRPARDTIWVLDSFKKSKADALLSPAPAPSSVPTEKPVADMSVRAPRPTIPDVSGSKESDVLTPKEAEWLAGNIHRLSAEEKAKWMARADNTLRQFSQPT